MLSEVDKWSQKYTWFRKMTVCFLVILISSVIGFFLTLSSAFISTACLIISFLSVLGIRIGLGKMDEFKSLYVNTVPMINPEKDFKEGRSLAENEELMLSKGVSADEVEAALEALVEEGQQLTQIEEIVVINESSQIEDVEVTELEEIQEETEATELEETQEETEATKLEETQEETEATELEETQEETEVTEVEETQEETEVTEVEETQEETEAEKLDDVQEESAQQTLSLEEQVFETIKMILRMNHCEVENLSFKTVGKYLTIYLKSRVMMRLKLTGRKHYVLTYLSQAEVEALGLVFDTPAKSEAYTSRVQFTSIAVLAQLEAQIVELYNRLVK
ncbi:DNA polymerase III subunit epsilon [Turicibacter sanguinis]|nr:DNA polymerase III subunit epsilon [Turicibacter sanguinis]